jgi:hypothetical protein
MLTRITIARPRRQTRLGDRVGMRVTILLTAFALLGALAPPAFAQARASTLTTSRDSAPPGATLSIAVDPALSANQPDGSHLVLRSAQGRRGGADMELRIVDWRGNAIRATIPRDADIGAGATRVLLLNRRNEVIAHSGNQMFRVAAAGELPNASRIAGAEGSRTSVPGSGPISRVPGSQVPDVAGRREAPDRSAGAVVPNVPNLLPSPDPRTERGVHARPAVPSTPGIIGQGRDPEVANEGAGARSARGSHRAESDFVVIADDGRTIPKNMRAPYQFNLPTDVRLTGRAVLFYVVNPDSSGIQTAVGVYLNGSEIRTHSFSNGMVRTMFETIDASRSLHPGANTLEFRSWGNATTVNDVVLMYHWLDAQDAPPPPAKAAGRHEAPPRVVIREPSPPAVNGDGPPRVVIR